MEPLSNEDVFLPEGQTYIVGLTVKSGQIDPSLQIYFASITEAIISMFHPSMQKFLAQGKEAANRGDSSFDDSLEIYVNVFFVKKEVLVKRPQNMGENTSKMQVQNFINNPNINIFREGKELEKAIQHDCHLEGTPAFLIDVPIHFDLTAIKENYVRILQNMDARNPQYQVMDRNLPVFLDVARDIDGKLNGLVFCDLNLLVHIESYILDNAAIVDAIRSYMNENYGIVGENYNPEEASRKGYMTLSQIIVYVRGLLQQNKDTYLTRVNVKVVETPLGLNVSPTSISPSLSAVAPATAPVRPTVGPFGNPEIPTGRDPFQGIPYDVLRVMGLNMDLESINRTCRTSSIFNNTFCSSQDLSRVEQFWQEKVRKDYGEELELRNANAQLDPTQGLNYYQTRPPLFPGKTLQEAVQGQPKMSWMNYYRYLAGPGAAEIVETIDRGLTTLQLLQLYVLFNQIIILESDGKTHPLIPPGVQQPYPLRDILMRIGGAVPKRLELFEKKLMKNRGASIIINILEDAGRAVANPQGRPNIVNFTKIRDGGPFRANTRAGLEIEATRPALVDALRPLIEDLKNNDILINIHTTKLIRILRELLVKQPEGIKSRLALINVDRSKLLSPRRTWDNNLAIQVQVPEYALDDRSMRFVKRILVKLFNMSDRNAEPDQAGPPIQVPPDQAQPPQLIPFGQFVPGQQPQVFQLLPGQPPQPFQFQPPQPFQFQPPQPFQFQPPQ